MNNKYYTGIGSRNISMKYMDLCADIAYQLNIERYTLRSGGCDGADVAFENGCDGANNERENPYNNNSKFKDIYLPWQDFNGNPSDLIFGMFDTTQEALDLAKQFHPNWGALKQGGQKLMARNCYQVLGHTLKLPSDFIVCYTENGEEKGGTSQALRLGKTHKIPIFNLGAYPVEQVMENWDKFFIKFKSI